MFHKKRENVGLKHFKDPKVSLNAPVVCRITMTVLKSAIYDRDKKF